MDSVKLRFMNEIAARLAAAADSRAKSELVEELAENLYQRYTEIHDAGLSEEEAFWKAMDDLGDVSELVAYLEGQEPESTAKSDPLDELMHDVEDITRNAFDLAKRGLRQVKDRLRNEGFYSYRSPGGHVEVQVGDDRDTQPKSWGYAMDDAGGFTKWGQSKDVVYGVGYDKKKGGFFAQWGEWKGENYMHISSMAPIPSQDIRGIDVQNVSGDVTVCLTEDEDGDILVAGDADQLEVSRSENGVLQVRPASATASSSFLFSRGVLTADIELNLPCRNWEFIRIKSVNGDVELSGSCSVDSVTVEAVNGDIEGSLSDCRRLELKSASGDIEWDGCADKGVAESASGDLTLNGSFTDLTASSMSGDIEAAGSVSGELRASSMSGDVHLETGSLPQAMTVSSKSGDCHVRVEPSGPFTAVLRTVSGDINSEFPFISYSRGSHTVGTGGGPEYRISTVSGDVRLEKY